MQRLLALWATVLSTALAGTCQVDFLLALGWQVGDLSKPVLPKDIH